MSEVSDYRLYRKTLRYDFFFSCAYCTTTEAEGGGIRFTIDHYEPRQARPDLINIYDNLMYACDICNSRKGDRSPPQAAREAGLRFYRPDQDVYGVHFKANGLLLEAITNVGKYTIITLDLNRSALRKLREIRGRFADSVPLVFEGVLGLKALKLDQIPREIRGRAQAAIKEICSFEESISSEIENLLRIYARSSLLDDDDTSEEQLRQKERLEQTKIMHALYPDTWRAPRKKRKKK